MAEPAPVSTNKGVILWKKGLVCCTCVHRGSDIEVILTGEGGIVHQELFADQRAAADYAIAKIHAYNAV